MQVHFLQFFYILDVFGFLLVACIFLVASFAGFFFAFFCGLNPCTLFLPKKAFSRRCRRNFLNPLKAVLNEGILPDPFFLLITSIFFLRFSSFLFHFFSQPLRLHFRTVGFAFLVFPWICLCKVTTS